MSVDISDPVTSELLTDFRQFTERRYMTISVPGFGDIRLRSLDAGELEKVRVASNQMAMAIALCVVNKDGDRTHTTDAEGIGYITSIDAKLFDALTDAINNFCLNQHSLADMVKNYE